jgi:hypothetical protein
VTRVTFIYPQVGTALEVFRSESDASFSDTPSSSACWGTGVILRGIASERSNQTRRYRLVVTKVGITASTTPTTATPSMARSVCSHPIHAMNRIEFCAPRMIQK